MTDRVPKLDRVKDDPTIRERIRGVETDQIGVLTYLDQLRPLQRSRPFVVRWLDAWPLLEALWQSPVKEDPRAGKIVAFYSKATGDLLGTTPTMVGGFQIIPPEDRGMAHEHSMAAILYAVSGHGYSVVNGKRYDWDAGDVVTFPAWTMHEHGNRDNEIPAVVFQVLDLPLIKAMRVLEMRELCEGYQTIADAPDAPEPSPEESRRDIPKAPMLQLLPRSEQQKLAPPVTPCIFKWKEVEPALTALLSSTNDDDGEERSLLLHNSLTAELKGTTPTLAAIFKVIPPGVQGRPHRHPAATIQYVVKGEGYLIADGLRLEWDTGDMVVLPGGSVHEEGNRGESEPAILFSISDFPLVNGMRIMYTREA